MMWDHWQRLENVTGEQDEEETENQKRVRLQIFPFSVFPVVKDDCGDV